MKKYTGIDYEARPESYWDDHDVLAALLRNVKGGERREMIRAYWEQGRLDDLGEVFLRDTLAEEERERLGQIHPLFMGGEYLPDYRLGEVEIARIELKSTTGDVISIRARKSGRRIRYRVVDEYATEFRQERQTSVRPLTLAEMIRFLDKSGTAELPNGLALGFNELNAGSMGRAYLRRFTRIGSEVYPQLGHHYENVFNEWVEAEQAASEPLEQENPPENEEWHESSI